MTPRERLGWTGALPALLLVGAWFASPASAQQTPDSSAQREGTPPPAAAPANEAVDGPESPTAGLRILDVTGRGVDEHTLREALGPRLSFVESCLQAARPPLPRYRIRLRFSDTGAPLDPGTGSHTDRCLLAALAGLRIPAETGTRRMASVDFGYASVSVLPRPAPAPAPPPDDVDEGLIAGVAIAAGGVLGAGMMLLGAEVGDTEGSILLGVGLGLATPAIVVAVITVLICEGGGC